MSTPLRCARTSKIVASRKSGLLRRADHSARPLRQSVLRPFARTVGSEGGLGCLWRDPAQSSLRRSCFYSRRAPAGGAIRAARRRAIRRLPLLEGGAGGAYVLPFK
eukprot:1195311-Prorocentrum_minimum.AAC.2